MSWHGNGLHRSSHTPQAKAERNLDDAFSKMIRARAGPPCIACGKPHKVYEAGHYHRRDCMTTRYDYWNVNGEGEECNHSHANKYGMKDMDLYRHNLDKRWGRGTADKLYRNSQKTKQWDVRRLQALTSAARMGFNVYKALYDSLGL